MNTSLKGWSMGGPSWDEAPAIGGKATLRSKAPDIEFVKMRTDATGSTPSQIVYSVRVRPQLRAATAPPGFQPEHRPPTTIKRKKKKKDEGPKLSEMDKKLQKLRLEREEKRRAEEEHGRYQDQVIKQWLMEKAETENARLRHEQSLKLREKRKMEKDRQRVERIESELAESEGDSYSLPEVPQVQRKTTRLSTSQYLQRQRQLLLEDYLRKHMSLPLQARSPVLAGLEQLQPPRPPKGSLGYPDGAKSHDEFVSQLSEMQSSLSMESAEPLPAIASILGE